ncbi:MAG TPA: T9SS type A sorting domain-containing protein [Panacibacter sp.]|nr:T9SS type A sorting domain-containing protein [Panacibacter sp.]HNP43866.1 T9SS type A sorting domain-containing protein [Panacibacter sp.]
MKKTILTAAVLLVVSGSWCQWATDSVHIARAGIPIAAIKNKLLLGSSGGNAWDVFDLQSNVHIYGTFSQSRTETQFAQTGNNAYFGGGKYGYFTDPQYSRNVDVYNGTTGTWSVLNLSLARSVGAAAATRDKVLFAGGIGRQDVSGPVYLYNRVDIFDASTGARTTAKLTKARTNISVAAVGNKILFAGGWFWDMSYNQVQTNVVDIYDNSTSAWSAGKLSQKRELMAVAVVGGKVLFAGGYNYLSGASRTVDIYDATTGSWSATQMSAGHYGMHAAVVGSKAYFAGGVEANNNIEVYDVGTGTWSIIPMPLNLVNFSTEVFGNNIYFAGGYDATRYSLAREVQVYNTITSTWSIIYLSQARYGISAAAIDGKMIFAGGYTAFGTAPSPSNRLDIYTQPAAVTTIAANIKQAIATTTIFPNPATDILFISLDHPVKAGAVVAVYNTNGKLLLKQQVAAGGRLIKLPVHSLPNAIYVYCLFNGAQQFTGKFVKE